MGHLAMEPAVITSTYGVENYLHSMALDSEGLIKAVRFAESERALCTSNDPIGFANMTAYARAARMLRDVYAIPGTEWERDNSFNQAAIRNLKRKIRVIPCNFDEGAGDRLVMPSNKSPKGEVSRQKAVCNRTMWMPGIVDLDNAFDDDGVRTWVLGMHFSDSRPTTAELSMPIDFDGNFFTNFSTRIILLDGTQNESDAQTDDASSFGVVDIQIKRK